MKPSFALTLIIGASLLLAQLQPVDAQEQEAGKEAQPRSALFEALEIRASEEAAWRTAGAGNGARSVEAWDRVLVTTVNFPFVTTQNFSLWACR